jgi:hypothetical protein
LEYIDTGFNPNYVYGAFIRRVTASAGNKEGNNALCYDIIQQDSDGFDYGHLRFIIRNCSTEKDLQLLDMLHVIYPEMINKLVDALVDIVRAGNHRLAAYVVEKGLKNGGYGFNKLHHSAVACKTPDELPKDTMKRASLFKKTIARLYVMPFHCACINPNP